MCPPEYQHNCFVATHALCAWVPRCSRFDYFVCHGLLMTKVSFTLMKKRLLDQNVGQLREGVNDEYKKRKIHSVCCINTIVTDIWNKITSISNSNSSACLILVNSVVKDLALVIVALCNPVHALGSSTSWNFATCMIKQNK